MTPQEHENGLRAVATNARITALNLLGHNL